MNSFDHSKHTQSAIYFFLSEFEIIPTELKWETKNKS